MRTKRDIVGRLVCEHELTVQQANGVFGSVLEGILEAVLTNGRLELRNFGVFQVKQRAARVARNPRTNQPVNLPARSVVTFEPSKRVAEVVSQRWPVDTPVEELVAD